MKGSSGKYGCNEKDHMQVVISGERKSDMETDLLWEGKKSDVEDVTSVRSSWSGERVLSFVLGI